MTKAHDFVQDEIPVLYCVSAVHTAYRKPPIEGFDEHRLRPIELNYM